MAKNPTNLYFNNVTSMGVSYSWENTAGSNNGLICTDLNHGSNNFVKRSKTVNLNVVNLDLNNAGGATIAKMARNQSRYVSTDAVRVYANGLYAGKGKLSDYSINEGSLSNDSVTNLTYLVSDDEEAFDQQDDPVRRDESVTVSRDLQNKSYKIEHSYSVSFGDDNDLISDHPLYKDKPNYSSVDGRLALAQKEANFAVYESPVNYNEYMDLSMYSTQNGWDLAKLENGCSGVSSSSSETKNYINGDYSLSKTVTLQYTGEDLDTTGQLYEIDYSMSWSQEERGQSNDLCAIVRMEGTVRGIAKNCGPELNASIYAESGYDKFVLNGPAKNKASDFFNYIKDNIDGVPTGELNDAVFDLKKQQCNPSVDRGDSQNNGEITFSFEMHNCPNYDSEYAATISNSSSVNVSYSDCGNKRLAVTESSFQKDVQAGECFLSIDLDGDYPKYNSITGAIDKNEIKNSASGAYNGQFDARYAIKSEEFTYSPYQGSQSYSVAYSDASKDENCNPISYECGEFKTKSKEKPRKPVYKDIESPEKCGEQIIGSYDPATKSVSTSLEYPKSCPVTGLKDLVGSLLDELNQNAPSCAITSMNWSAAKNSDGSFSVSANMEGINEKNEEE